MKRRAEKYERIGSENPTVGIASSLEPPRCGQQSKGITNWLALDRPEDLSYTNRQIEVLREMMQQETMG